MNDQFATYFARGYGGGGTDPLTDADIEGTGVTAAHVVAGITLAENLPKFIDSATEEVFRSEYDETVSRLRQNL